MREGAPTDVLMLCGKWCFGQGWRAGTLSICLAFSFSWGPFFGSTRAASILPSRPPDGAAAARRACQGWPRLRGHPKGLALYEAFEVKHYFTAFSTSFITVSLFDLESRFFAPTHTCWRPARTGAVKVGRRSGLAAGSVVPGRP